MIQSVCNSPLLLIVFNRPGTTARVFETIRGVRPRQLFVAADGPRPNCPEDLAKCEDVRAIVSRVDWDCEVKTLFRERNLGCRHAVSSAIDWFFGHVEEGIVLEDDCLPDPTFFRFCEELLAYYRDDERIMQICGSNFIGGGEGQSSYYFSRYGPVWGWASWRRAWAHNDVSMAIWPKVKETGALRSICLTEQELEMRTSLYERLWRGEIDTWDYQWGFAKMINSGLSITPRVNLISNIGFGAGATHTADEGALFANHPTGVMSFPLFHPDHICRSLEADKKFLERFVFAEKPEKKDNPFVAYWHRFLKRL